MTTNVTNVTPRMLQYAAVFRNDLKTMDDRGLRLPGDCDADLWFHPVNHNTLVGFTLSDLPDNEIVTFASVGDVPARVYCSTATGAHIRYVHTRSGDWTHFLDLVAEIAQRLGRGTWPGNPALDLSQQLYSKQDAMAKHRVEPLSDYALAKQAERTPPPLTDAQKERNARLGVGGPVQAKDRLQQAQERVAGVLANVVALKGIKQGQYVNLAMQVRGAKEVATELARELEQLQSDIELCEFALEEADPTDDDEEAHRTHWPPNSRDLTARESFEHGSRVPA